jgi:hypothetical protein
LESLAFTDTMRSSTTIVQEALVAAINSTDYYQGYIGVGLTKGRFGTNVTNPLLTQLVETYGFVPSHSYGYTAGANFGKSSSFASGRLRLACGFYIFILHLRILQSALPLLVRA